MSETSKYRHLTTKYCYRADGQPGCGVDVASQGDSVVPWAMGFDLPQAEFNIYCGGAPAKGDIQLRGWANSLPFESKSLDFVYSSHLLEDYPRNMWPNIMGEWQRCLKIGGYLIILVPEVTEWNYATVVVGQSDNAGHSKPEPSVGDMSKVAKELGMEIIEEGMTKCFDHDYTILGVFKNV